MKSVIFDFGANIGQNITYFLDRSYYVVCVEANPLLCEKIKIDYKNFIEEGRLYVENFAISNLDNNSEIFYVHKKKNTHSQLDRPLINVNEFYKINVKVLKSSNFINNYLKKLDLEKAYYIKIDIEHLDHVVLKDILDNAIKFDYISCEVHSSFVLQILILSNLNLFKVVNGKDVKNFSYINNENLQLNFLHHSSGAFGNDIVQKWINKSSLITFFVNHGFGWVDVCCSRLNEKNIDTELKYDVKIHEPFQPGFKFHLKRLIPEFVRSLKNVLKI